ncbi:hypothetical protein O0L34_g13449 [Tuta absoluta]|nr:hypothetical protein O0L34_g13449 [Tuta absoluta]
MNPLPPTSQTMNPRCEASVLHKARHSAANQKQKHVEPAPAHEPDDEPKMRSKQLVSIQHENDEDPVSRLDSGQRHSSSENRVKSSSEKSSAENVLKSSSEKLKGSSEKLKGSSEKLKGSSEKTSPSEDRDTKRSHGGGALGAGERDRYSVEHSDDEHDLEFWDSGRRSEHKHSTDHSRRSNLGPPNEESPQQHFHVTNMQPANEGDSSDANEAPDIVHEVRVQDTPKDHETSWKIRDQQITGGQEKTRDHEEARFHERIGYQEKARSQEKDSSYQHTPEDGTNEQTTSQPHFRHGASKPPTPLKVVMRSNLTFNLGDEFFKWRANDDVRELLGELAIPSNSSRFAPPLHAWVKPAPKLTTTDSLRADLASYKDTPSLQAVDDSSSSSSSSEEPERRLDGGFY